MITKETMLIIEDEKNIGNYIETILISNGYKALRAVNGMSGLSMCTSHHPDMILLDLGLPDIDGMEVLRRVRGFSNVPIIVISARIQEREKIEALDAGADDYITKPFSLPVLYAKAIAVMNRIRGNESFQLIKKGDIEINVRTHEVKIKNEVYEMAPLEYKMLVFFLENPNRVFSREQILIRFWGYDFEGTERVVDNHIKKLRKIIENSSCKIKTVRKAGYRMEV